MKPFTRGDLRNRSVIFEGLRFEAE